MPLQNRVDPWGNLHAVSARGAYLGNRGILHDGRQKIAHKPTTKAWVTCQLNFGPPRKPEDPKPKLFQSGSYSELFFLDEATALSAGHRPCSTCRRSRFNEFKAIWLKANKDLIDADDVKIGQIDKVMQSERVGHLNTKISETGRYGDLPEGTIFEFQGDAILYWRGRAWTWSFEGYQPSRHKLTGETDVEVLTPTSIVRMFILGFRPQVHISAYN